MAEFGGHKVGRELQHAGGRSKHPERPQNQAVRPGARRPPGQGQERVPQHQQAGEAGGAWRREVGAGDVHAVTRHDARAAGGQRDVAGSRQGGGGVGKLGGGEGRGVGAGVWVSPGQAAGGRSRHRRQRPRPPAHSIAQCPPHLDPPGVPLPPPSGGRSRTRPSLCPRSRCKTSTSPAARQRGARPLSPRLGRGRGQTEAPGERAWREVGWGVGTGYGGGAGGQRRRQWRVAGGGDAANHLNKRGTGCAEPVCGSGRPFGRRDRRCGAGQFSAGRWSAAPGSLLAVPGPPLPSRRPAHAYRRSDLGPPHLRPLPAHARLGDGPRRWHARRGRARLCPGPGAGRRCGGYVPGAGTWKGRAGRGGRVGGAGGHGRAARRRARRHRVAESP